MSNVQSPTLATYGALEKAFEHFNRDLFDARLPPCLLTLRSSPRTYGYMHRRRFVNLGGAQIDELGINPGYFAIQSPEEVLATLVHEMVHHWQHHCGTPSKSLPHNREWADKMQEIGLMPSHTGLPGGKRTGRSMSDYIVPNGVFLSACSRLTQAGFSLPWLDSHVAMNPGKMQERRTALVASGVAAVGGEPPIATALAHGFDLPVNAPTPPSAAPQRVRYVCPQCGVRAWAAPDTVLNCGVCEVALESSKHGG